MRSPFRNSEELLVALQGVRTRYPATAGVLNVVVDLLCQGPVLQAVDDELSKATDLGFVERAEGGHGRESIKRSHRAEGRNFVD